MRAALAQASLIRHRSRTLLAVLGVAIAAAMLLDMVMLSTGMRESFRELLLSRGFELRLAPKGTLPFDTDATIAGVGAITRVLRTNPDIREISPVMGGSIHVLVGNGDVSGSVLGIDPSVQGDSTIFCSGAWARGWATRSMWRRATTRRREPTPASASW